MFERAALVNSILKFPTNMVFFTTPELLEIGDLPFVTPYAKPTRDEALRYYRRTVDAFDLTVRLGYEVSSIARQPGPNDAAVLAVDVDHPHEGPLRRLARTVVVAVGAYDCPNRLGIPGEDLPHVSHYYAEAHPWYRKQVVVVGGKNSAAEAALELYRSGARVTLVHRHAELGRASSTGSGPTSRTASRKARYPRASRPAWSRSGRARSSSSRRRGGRCCRPTPCSC